MTPQDKACVDSIVLSVKSGLCDRKTADPIIRQYHGNPDALFAVQEVSAGVAVLTAPIVEELTADDSFDSGMAIPQPDSNGEFVSPSSGAKWMAATYQIPQIPLNGKVPILKDWPNHCTLDSDQIDKWAEEHTGCNFGSVAKSVPSGKFVLEVDSPDVSRRAQQNGVSFSSELIIVSRQGRGHRWYLQSDETIKTGNIGQGNVKGGDWSLRVEDMQCVSPGSINPKSGKQYRVKKAGPVGMMPLKELEWLKSQRTSEASGKKEIVRNSAGLVPHGSIHDFLLKTSGRLRHDGLSSEEIEPILLRLAHENCQPPLDDEKIRQMARSIGNYKEGNPAAEHIYFATADNGETEPVIQEDALPDFPRFTGSLADLSDAICPDITWAFKFMAAVTHFGLIRSGLDTLENETHLQPRFYTCFIKEPGWGKTAAINEIRRAMQMVSTDYVVTSSIDSAPSLVDEFKEQEVKASFRGRNQDGRQEDPNQDGGIRQSPPSKVLLDPDEMKDLFEKTKSSPTSRNSMMTELLKMYETNITGNRARATKKGKIEVRNAHLAILGGAVKTGYEAMWVGTGGGALGMQSRMVLVATNDPKMSIEKTPTNLSLLETVLPRLRKQAERARQVIKLDPEARTMLNTWWASEPRDSAANSRVDDMVKRMLIILAATNDVSVIGTDLMGQAIAFGNYETALRDHFNSPDSYSWVQSFEQAIIKVAKKRAQSMTFNQFKQYVNAGSKPGGLGTFLQAWRNVLQAGDLLPDGKTRKGTAVYRLG